MKTCFKCGVSKPIGEFYAHPQMKDGHLGKCKICTRRDTALRHAIKSNDPEWVVSELIRHRAKSERFRREGRAVKPKRESAEKWAVKNRWKRKAHTALNNAIRAGKIIKRPCQVCGNPKSEGHHEDYSKPLDVMWLCRKHHGEFHHQKNINRILTTTKREVA
jgi:hypothetical protein